MYQKGNKVMFHTHKGSVFVGTIINIFPRQIEDEYEDIYLIQLNENASYQATEDQIIQKLD
jgi:hypothetical protein